MFNIDRRGILKASAYTAMAMAVGISPTRAKPRVGGKLRLALAGANTSDSLDPALWTSVMMQVGMMGGVYNNLTEVAAGGELKPELAVGWESTPDAKSWTFKLRKGVQFHNGKEMTSRDVIASINHHRVEDSKSVARALVAPIHSMEAPDKHTVVFHLDDGNADFPFILNDVHLVIMQEKDGRADWQSAIGTGGYKFVSFEPGVNLILKRQDNYWKDGHGNFDEVELLGIADAVARQTALITGEVHAINRVDLKTIHHLERLQHIVIEEVTGTQHMTMPMAINTAPFRDKNVRLALKHALNRDLMVEFILKGRGRIGNDHPIAPSNRYYAKDLEQTVYDPDQARFYLNKAGLDHLNIELSAADAAFNGAVDAAVLFKEQALKSGINVTVNQEANDGYWANVWRKKPFCMCFWGGRPTEDWMFSTAYSADAKWNDTGWKNERFNSLLIMARSELDEDKRRSMYFEMQSLVRDDGGTIVPMYANYVDARSSKLAHSGHLGSNWELDGWKILDRWWFAE
ncbi:ABC transporter substrate-binding protein [Kiloniella sp. b19]|uniref:ABC transporter substrate-binding protein n=1 Tax=Kiloniella sp. GXU_MW_B19 TaxID=3141326 RepID=UPI0031D29115